MMPQFSNFLKITGLLVCLPLFSFGQDYSILSIPPELIEDANSIVRNSELTFNVLGPGEAIETKRTVVTLLNDKSPYDLLFAMYDNSKKIKSASAAVYDAFGKRIEKFKLSDFEDVSAISSFSIYDDDRVKYLEIGYSKYPFTVVFEFERVYKDIFDYPDWHVQQFSSVSVQQSSYTIEVPTGLDVRYKVENFEPEFKESKGNRDVYEWSISNLHPIKKEPYSPHIAEVNPILYVAPTLFEIEGYSGDMSSWASFGDFQYLINKDRDALSAELKAEISKLISEADTDEEKVRILYRYLQDNTRYVSVQLGIGGWQTFDAQYVETNKYGDCKALTNFMKSMLREVGIESYAALIYAGSNPPPISDEFSQPMFNHVVLYVPEKDSDNGNWLECTSSENPAFYLGYSNENRQALLVTPDGGKLIDTPVSQAMDNYLETSASVIINEDGGAGVDVKSLFNGRQQESLRTRWAKAKKEEQEEWLHDYLDLPSFETDVFTIVADDDQPIVDVSYSIDVKKYGSKSGKRLFIKPNMLNRFSNVPDAVEERINPIVNKYAFIDRDSISFMLPQGFRPESVPTEDFELDTEFGTYTLKTTIEGNKMIYIRTMELKPFHLPADRYEDMRNFYKKVKKMDNSKVVFVNAT